MKQQSALECGHVEHDDRLHQPRLAEGAPSRNRIDVRVDEDPLAGQLGRGRVLCGEPRQGCPRHAEGEGGDANHGVPASPDILIPSTMNCTAIAHSTRPIQRVRMRIPVWPNRCSTRVAVARVRNETKAVRAIAP